MHESTTNDMLGLTFLFVLTSELSNGRRVKCFSLIEEAMVWKHYMPSRMILFGRCHNPQPASCVNLPSYLVMPSNASGAVACCGELST